MQCNLTVGCNGILQLKPEQDESIKFYLECDTCKETHIVQRTKEELIDLYKKRIRLLEACIDLQSIYANEAQELLSTEYNDDLKYLPIAQEIIRRSKALNGGKDETCTL